MSSKTRTIVVGAFTTLAILVVGFGADSMPAVSFKQPSGYQPREVAQPSTQVRVILPSSAEPAHAPEPSTIVASATEFRPQPEPVKAVRAPAEVAVASANNRAAATAATKESRRHDAERKSRRMAARDMQRMAQSRQRPEIGILAFGGDEPSRRGGFFGN